MHFIKLRTIRQEIIKMLYVKHSWALMWKIACLLLLVRTEGEEITLCEYETDTIGCPEGSFLVFDSANFGRTNRTACGGGETTKCVLEGTVGKLNRACYGRQSCDLSATTDVFDDPCPKSSKYLQATYNCITANEVAELCKGRRRFYADVNEATGSGYIISPGYPGKYLSDEECYVHVRPPAGHRFNVDLLDLDVEDRGQNKAGCYDTLVVYDPDEPVNTFNYCGTLSDVHTYEPAHTEQIKNLAIKLRTDGMNHRSGFLIKYTRVVDTVKQEL